MDVLSLIMAFFASWQVKVLLGLILLDTVFAIAVSLKTNQFDWAKLADFYRVMVMPYLLGYLALYIAINFILPIDNLGEIGDYINVGMVTLAWGVLIASLGGRIKSNFALLYASPTTAKKN